MDAPGTAELVAQLLNAAYMVRHYVRGGRSSIGKAHRAQAIQQMGLAVREAFSQSDDFEPLLAAVANGLSPRDDPPF